MFSSTNPVIFRRGARDLLLQPDRGALGFSHFVVPPQLQRILKHCPQNSASFQIIYNIKKGSVCADDQGVNLSAEEVCQRIFQEVDVNSDGAC